MSKIILAMAREYVVDDYITLPRSNKHPEKRIFVHKISDLPWSVMQRWGQDSSLNWNDITIKMYNHLISGEEEGLFDGLDEPI